MKECVYEIAIAKARAATTNYMRQMWMHHSNYVPIMRFRLSSVKIQLCRKTRQALLNKKIFAKIQKLLDSICTQKTFSILRVARLKNWQAHTRTHICIWKAELFLRCRCVAFKTPSVNWCRQCGCCCYF